jgi:thiol-disulfide isomerase/thioredoxin
MVRPLTLIVGSLILFIAVANDGLVLDADKAAAEPRADLVDDTADANTNVLILNEENFERTTQVATGHTTGDWFVMFGSVGCGHCVRAKPALDKLSLLRDEHNTNVAFVDCQESDWVCSRFKVRGYPTFYLFKRGKMYRYDGDRTTSSFVAFIDKTYAKADAVSVPREPTLYDKFMIIVSVFHPSEMEPLREHAPLVYYGLYTMLAICGGMTLYVVWMLIGMFAKKEARSTTKRPAEAEQKKKQ